MAYNWVLWFYMEKTDFEEVRYIENHIIEYLVMTAKPVGSQE